MKLTNREIADLCRGLSLLLHSGISLSDGVFLLAQEAAGETRELLNTLGTSMDLGVTLSQAAADSGAFPDQVSGMLTLGESTGRMEEALRNLAEFYDQRQRTSHNIRVALTYPAILLALMLGVIAILLTKVLPVFDGVYASLGSGLTGVSEALLRLGQVLTRGMPVLLVLLGTAAIFVLFVVRCRSFREMILRWFALRFGDNGIFQKFNNARFVQALAMAVSSGLPLEDALGLAKDLLSDSPQAVRRIEICANALAGGADLAQAMADARLLSPRESRLLAVGQRSGSADQVLEDMARRMEADAQEYLENKISKIEPAMVLICSALVGVILLAVMLPLMNILSAMG